MPIGSQSTLRNIIILVVIIVGSVVLLDFTGLLGAVGSAGQFVTSQLFVGFIFIGIGLFLLTKKLSVGMGFGTQEVLISGVLVFGILMYMGWLPFSILMAIRPMAANAGIQIPSVSIPSNIVDLFTVPNIVAGLVFSGIVYCAIKKG